MNPGHLRVAFASAALSSSTIHGAGLCRHIMMMAEFEVVGSASDPAGPTLSRRAGPSECPANFAIVSLSCGCCSSRSCFPRFLQAILKPTILLYMFWQRILRSLHWLSQRSEYLMRSKRFLPVPVQGALRTARWIIVIRCYIYVRTELNHRTQLIRRLSKVVVPHCQHL